MTPDRFAWAMVILHGVALAVVWVVARRWRERARCALPAARWLTAVGVDVGGASVIACLAALSVAVAVNAGLLRRLHLGSISGLLMGQALFAEGALLAFALAWRHG